MNRKLTIIGFILWFILAVCSFGAFPTHTSTGTFNIATSGDSAWDDFVWRWSDQDNQQMSLQFTGCTGGTNIMFRLAKPMTGPYWLQVNNCSMSDDGTNTAYTLPVALHPTNLPPTDEYWAEFILVNTGGYQRTIARGTVWTEWSLFSITNSTSWTPRVVTYYTTASVTLVESDPLWSTSVSYRITVTDTGKWDAAASWVAAYSNSTPTNGAVLNTINTNDLAAWNAGGTNIASKLDSNAWSAARATDTNNAALGISANSNAVVGLSNVVMGLRAVDTNLLAQEVIDRTAADTNKVAKTGDTMSGALQIDVPGGIPQSGGYKIYSTNLIITGGSGVSIGTDANGQLRGVAVGMDAIANTSGVAIGLNAFGSDFGVAIGADATGGYYGVAIGGAALGYSYGTAIGAFTVASNNGVAVGMNCKGYQDGIGIGKRACGYQNGIAMGKESIAHDYGIGIGRATDGSYSNIAIGLAANAHPSNEAIRRIAIGTAVSNDVGNDTIMVRGNLYLDGGSNFYYRPSFQSGAWSLFSPTNTVTWDGLGPVSNGLLDRAGFRNADRLTIFSTNGLGSELMSGVAPGGSVFGDSGVWVLNDGLSGTLTLSNSTSATRGAYQFSYVIANASTGTAVTSWGGSTNSLAWTGPGTYSFALWPVQTDSLSIAITNTKGQFTIDPSMKKASGTNYLRVAGPVQSQGTMYAPTGSFSHAVTAPNITTLETNSVQRTGSTMYGNLVMNTNSLTKILTAEFLNGGSINVLPGAWYLTYNGAPRITVNMASNILWGDWYCNSLNGNAFSLTNLPITATGATVSQTPTGTHITVTSAGVTNLYDLNLVDSVATPTANDVLLWNGAAWSNKAVAGTGDFLADGTVPMSGPLNIGGQLVTNIGAGGYAVTGQVLYAEADAAALLANGTNGLNIANAQTQANNASNGVKQVGTLSTNNQTAILAMNSASTGTIALAQVQADGASNGVKAVGVVGSNSWLAITSADTGLQAQVTTLISSNASLGVSNTVTYALALAASIKTNILPVASWSFLSAKTDATGEWKTVWSPKWYSHAIPLVEVGYWCDAGTATVELLSRDLAGVFTTLNVVNVNCATYSNVAAGGALAVSNMLGLRVQDGVSATSLYFGVSGWLP